MTGADDAKRIIKRVSFFYADQEVAQAQLLSLRRDRNSHVHAGAKPERLGTKNFQLSVFVEHLLVFIISNHFKFENSAKWHKFMSTTSDAQSIDEQIARLKRWSRSSRPHCMSSRWRATRKKIVASLLGAIRATGELSGSLGRTDCSGFTRSDYFHPYLRTVPWR
ncbi:hypothetical protein [Duganella sp. Dugasp56]|uniref:hypothetical protein n=1 Tax=Duganella sp. Dugasp56 TaxID=3243046 RepID=UPI0039B02792